MIGNRVYKTLKSKKVSNHDKISLCLYFTDIKNIFRTYNETIAIQRLEELLTKYNDIPRTSNHVENYYRQTEPEQIKTKYKTNKGILSYINLKMKNWTPKHGKNQHPITLQFQKKVYK